MIRLLTWTKQLPTELIIIIVCKHCFQADWGKFIYVSICLPFYLSVFLSVSLSSCVILSVFPPTCLPFCVFLLFVLMSVNLSFCMSACLSVSQHLYVCLLVCLSSWLSFSPFFCQSFYRLFGYLHVSVSDSLLLFSLPVPLTVSLTFCPSVCLTRILTQYSN